VRFQRTSWYQPVISIIGGQFATICPKCDTLTVNSFPFSAIWWYNIASN